MYQPTPAFEKTRIPRGAYEGVSRSHKAAGVRMTARSEDSESTSGEDSAKTTKTKKKAKNAKKTKKTREKEVAAVKETTEIKARIPAEALRPQEAPMS